MCKHNDLETEENVAYGVSMATVPVPQTELEDTILSRNACYAIIQRREIHDHEIVV